MQNQEETRSIYRPRPTGQALPIVLRPRTKGHQAKKRGPPRLAVQISAQPHQKLPWPVHGAEKKIGGEKGHMVQKVGWFGHLVQQRRWCQAVSQRPAAGHGREISREREEREMGDKENVGTDWRRGVVEPRGGRKMVKRSVPEA